MSAIKDGDLLFSCECDEPKIGKITRNVYKVTFTPENLNSIYEKAKEFRTLMGWEILTKEQFFDFFVQADPRNNNQFLAKGLCARVDNFVGIFWLTDINCHHQPFDASIHYTFFDRRTRGRLELCRTVIKYLLDLYPFNRLHTQVPMYIHATREFVRSIGFRQEGMILQNAMYKGQLFNTELSALLRSEVEDGSAWKRGDDYIAYMAEQLASKAKNGITQNSNDSRSESGNLSTDR